MIERPEQPKINARRLDDGIVAQGMPISAKYYSSPRVVESYRVDEVTECWVIERSQIHVIPHEWYKL
jgi:hypothetical protein